MMEPKWLSLRIVAVATLLLLEGCRWWCSDACWEPERVALLQLKPCFNRFNDLKSWVEVEGSDCCQWQRVECNTSTRRVITLSLDYTTWVDWELGLKIKDYWYLNASLFLPFEELKSLYLEGNRIAGFVENEGFAKLSSALCNLETLDLTDNYLNDSIILSLSELSSLKYLYLAYNQLTGSSHANGVQWLSRLSNLETLDLERNSLKNNILFHTSGLSSLKTLYLGNNKLKGTIHIQELNNLTNLKYLDLKGNKIESLSNQGNKTQLKLTNLEELDLSSNLFKNNTLAFPSGLSSLKSLSMSDNKLQGSIDIKEFNNFPSLKILDLGRNQIESFQSFKANCKQVKLTNLEELDLSGNLFKNNTLAFPSGLSSLKSLHMSDNQFQGSINIKDFNNLINLKTLDLRSNQIESFRSFKANDKQLELTNLEELYLDGNLFNNSGFASLSKLSNLKSLWMGQNQLKGLIDMKNLVAFTNLKVLYMGGNELEDFVTHKEFHVSSNLEEIYLDRSSSLNTNILQSIGVLTSLKTLSLSGCGLTGSLPNQGWCDLRNIKKLDISGNALEGVLPYCLGNLTSLHELVISDNQFIGNLTPLANLTSLTFVSLSKNHFQIPMSFMPLLKLPNLKVLLSDENKMVTEPSFQTSLPKFQLKYISLSKCTTDQELSLEPFQSLYHQYDLRYVDLSYNNFSGAIPVWLLENNTKLEDLFLMGNSFKGPLSLPSVINLNLSSVDISDNKLRGQIPPNICSTFPHLERLVLSKNAFEGNIPSCFSGMSALRYLDLSNNQMSGKVPEELITRSSLKVLRLSKNNFSGNMVPLIFNSYGLSNLYLDGNNFVGEILDIDISAYAGFPYSLEDIDLSNNSLRGKLPRWMGNMSSLRRLALSNNRFEGSIPMEFCNLYDLEFLDLSQNNLSGSIPSCFNPSSIKHVHLNKNKLSGPLTRAFYNSSSLVTLDLRGNNLTGNIPEWIGTLSALSVLLLKGNHLHGEIPIQLCELYSLSIIDLSQNMFFGSIPSCLGNLTLPIDHRKSWIKKMSYMVFLREDLWTYIGKIGILYSTPHEYPDTFMEEWVEYTTKNGTHSYGGSILTYMTGIDLSCNKLTGQIPFELGNLSGIYSLNLSHNSLTGDIPSSFSKLKQIESLDLSYNNLSGRIPFQLVELNTLEVFSVAYNNLSGSIPEPKAQFGTFTESSYEGNPFLCGLMLHKSCSKTDSPSTTPITSDDEGESSLLDTCAFCVGFLVSYVAVLLGIFAALYMNPYWRQAWFSFIEGCITNCRYSVVGNFLELHIFKRRA